VNDKEWLHCRINNPLRQASFKATVLTMAALVLVSLFCVSIPLIGANSWKSLESLAYAMVEHREEDEEGNDSAV
jgi:hypothetical protein